MIKVIFGKRGTGKSHYVKNVIIPEIGKKDMIVIDVMQEYNKGVIVKTYSDLVDYVKYCRSNRYRIKAILRTENESQDAQAFSLYKLRNIAFVIEETHWHCSPQKIEPELDGLIKYGRHYDCDIYAISQRPAEINRIITSNAREIIITDVSEPRDIEYLEKIGITTEMLENREYVEIESDGEKIKIHVPLVVRI